MQSGTLQTHQSFWIASTLQSNYPALTTDLAVDVAIVGAGMAGITTAMLLKKAGKTVAVLEAGQVAEGASGHTTAKITSLHQLKYAGLIKSMGEAKAGVYGASNQAAIEQMATLVRDEQIDCDFERKDAFTFAQDADTLEQVKQEAEAAVRLGLPATFVTETSLPFEVVGAVKFTQQAQFHPGKYLLSLAEKINGDGSFVFEQTRVCTVEEEALCRVKTDRGPTVTAQDVIITTNLPILDQGLYFAKTYPQRSYLIGARIDAAIAPNGMFIGTGEKYRSIRTTPMDNGETLLLMGGEGHKVGEADDTKERFARLAADAATYFGVTSVDYYWSSQDFVSFDSVPYIGKLTPINQHIYVATGFSLWGMTNSTVAAMLLADLVQGRSNAWADLYDATRATPFVSTQSLKNNFDVGTHWVGDRLKGLFESPDTLAPDQGGLVTINGEKVAAYRDERGDLHKVSAICPHLGCVVAWNAAEKSWDCPCHGSRFDTAGKVLHGPAVKTLEAK
ncbi:MAG: FAD-dependent oxidoreductase [Leptolyngbyaceae cyanobacterium]